MLFIFYVVCWSAAKQKSQFFERFFRTFKKIASFVGVVVEYATCILNIYPCFYSSLCFFVCCWWKNSTLTKDVKAIHK